MGLTKEELRKSFLAKRKKLLDNTHAEKSLAIAQQCVNLPLWNRSIFHLFLPMQHKKEVDTLPLLTMLQGKDKQVVLPKIVGNKLEHILLTDDTLLKANYLGIVEPQKGIQMVPNTIEVVFVPLLAFDKKGHRVGYGKGYYDKFLSHCAPSTIKVGLTFFTPVEKIQDIETTDIALDYVISPDIIYSF